ncbi:hypothetical protein FC21_GL000962 [Limosilactobacillus equigenerosi DSM 18793 = JCM 14505]|uniref:Gram-positive cocci surface proteins LPxTG domain-containing protein n=1 Tax=Limosilactobacillus equigenerosi DSM 18793 = JCM 14505 TaxID=1423742 RepID=A0A0R1UNX7_9LACO|nr:hypothetical protein FC21_GL000962 [Limosilactobacillus equigenerosi DSM 18793 = JCM 14505]
MVGVSVVSWGLCQPTAHADSGDEWQPITDQPTLVGTYDENNFPDEIWTPVTTDADYHDVLSDGDRAALPTGEDVPTATPTKERTPVDFGQVNLPDQGQVTVVSEAGDADQQATQQLAGQSDQVTQQQNSSQQDQQQVTHQQSGLQQQQQQVTHQQNGDQQVGGQTQQNTQQQSGLQIQIQVPQQLQTNQVGNQYLAIEITGIKELQQLQRRQVQVLIGGKPIAAGMISDFRCEQGRVKLLLADQTIVDTMDHVQRLVSYAGQPLTIILPFVSRQSQAQAVHVQVEYGTGQRSSDGTTVEERQVSQHLEATTVIDWLKQHLANFDLHPTVINHDDHSVTNTDNHHDVTNTTVISQPNQQAGATAAQSTVVDEHNRQVEVPNITIIDRHDVTNNNYHQVTNDNHQVTNNNYYQVTNDNHQTVTNQDRHDVVTNRNHHDVITNHDHHDVISNQDRHDVTTTQVKQADQTVASHQAVVTATQQITGTNQTGKRMVMLTRTQLVGLLQQAMRHANQVSGRFNQQGSWRLGAVRSNSMPAVQTAKATEQVRLPQTGASNPLAVIGLGLVLLFATGLVIKKVY